MIVIVNLNGKVEQSGKPTDVYTHPKTHFVASFMGNYNILKPEQFQHFSRQRVGASIAIRPEVIDSSRLPFEPDDERYTLQGKIVDQSTSGNSLSYYVDCAGIPLRVDELYRSFNLVEIGEDVHLSFEKRNCLEV